MGKPSVEPWYRLIMVYYDILRVSWLWRALWRALNQAPNEKNLCFFSYIYKK